MPRTKQPLSVRAEKTQLKRYRAAFLDHPVTMQAVEKVAEIAMDDNHQGQMTALKFIMERAYPVMGFTAETAHANKASAIQINITGLGETKVDTEEPLEGEYTDETEEDQ